jgi:hypothetical protein
MPNGKGFIDCRYCAYAWPEDDQWPLCFGGPVRCLYHRRSLPPPSEGTQHRFCINIVANEYWFGESSGLHLFSPFIRQVARFGAELEPGVLYEYQPQNAGSLRALAKLREPDYENRSWKNID